MLGQVMGEVQPPSASKGARKGPWRLVTRTLAKRAIQIANLAGEQHAYDAQFLALAERLQCDLWTADEDFRRAMHRNSFTQVKTISAYPLHAS